MFQACFTLDHVWEKQVTGLKILQPLYWSRKRELTKPHDLVWRGIVSAGSKCMRMDTALKAYYNLVKASSASGVHSHLTCWDVLEFCTFASRCDISIVSLEYFLMNCKQMLANSNSTCMSPTDCRVGQSLIVDMWFNSMAIPAVHMTNLNNTTFQLLQSKVWPLAQRLYILFMLYLIGQVDRNHINVALHAVINIPP
jgi:hypothetical protein